MELKPSSTSFPGFHSSFNAVWYEVRTEAYFSATSFPPESSFPESPFPPSGVFCSPEFPFPVRFFPSGLFSPSGAPAPSGSVCPSGFPPAADVSTLPRFNPHPTAVTNSSSKTASQVFGFRYDNIFFTLLFTSFPPNAANRPIPFAPCAMHNNAAEYSFLISAPICSTTHSSQDISISSHIFLNASQTRGWNQ